MWHAFNTQEAYLTGLVNKVSTTLRQAIAMQGSAGLAVSGGKSPIPMFQHLSQADLPWEKIHISLVDERLVAPDSPDSNEYLVRQHLLVNRASQATFTGLVSDPGNIEHCVEQANKQSRVINLALLGMGDDGHTASLFPGAPQLPLALSAKQPQRYLHISPPTAPYERISMTLSAILKVQHIVLAIAGDHKRLVFKQAAQLATPALPVSYLITQTGTPFDTYWHA
ncbi:6-phosphogluconolactonase [Alcaligenaceae bacterium]|nr:6-phosphogluconolactonase [Alcaligenaceae bacterium]